MLPHAVLCCAVLCCAVLCYASLLPRHLLTILFHMEVVLCNMGLSSKVIILPHHRLLLCTFSATYIFEVFTACVSECMSGSWSEHTDEHVGAA